MVNLFVSKKKKRLVNLLGKMGPGKENDGLNKEKVKVSTAETDKK